MDSNHDGCHQDGRDGSQEGHRGPTDGVDLEELQLFRPFGLDPSQHLGLDAAHLDRLHAFHDLDRPGQATVVAGRQLLVVVGHQLSGEQLQRDDHEDSGQATNGAAQTGFALQTNYFSEKDEPSNRREKYYRKESNKLVVTRRRQSPQSH